MTAHFDLIKLTNHSLDGDAPWAAAVIRALAEAVRQGGSDQMLIRILHAHVVAGPYER